jgi:cobyrinic acid a,c-diamide synthase
VQPYKAGPDYIDPTWHTAVTGVPSRNLDLWMLSKRTVRRLASRPADLSIIEGVMGLFDGPGSTAELARLLKAPVVLVVDGHGMAGSAAAIVRGYETLQRGVRVAGVILNRVSGESHYQLLREAIERHCKARVLGYLPKDNQLRLPERHLGLVPAREATHIDQLADRLVGHLERTVDLDAVLEIAGTAPPLDERSSPGPYAAAVPTHGSAARIAVARDEAFCFYYEDNLDLLRSYGAELVFFSPLADGRLPDDVDGVYFGGGFPELFADQLRQSRFADLCRVRRLDVLEHAWHPARPDRNDRSFAAFRLLRS